MDRHSEYKYSIAKLYEKYGWIFIDDMDSGWKFSLFDWSDDDQYNGPVEFVLRIKDSTNWDIEKINALQYRFKQDPLKLIFQMDDLLGFVVIVPDWGRVDEVVAFLNSYMS